MKHGIESIGYHQLAKFVYVYEEEMKFLKIVIPLLNKKLASLQKRYEYFEGIHQSGEATNRQVDKMLKLDEDCLTLKKMIEFITGF